MIGSKCSVMVKGGHPTGCCCGPWTGLVYMALVIQEARKNVRRTYDQIFRQNPATDPTADWAGLDASLYAATFLVQ